MIQKIFISSTSVPLTLSNVEDATGILEGKNFILVVAKNCGNYGVAQNISGLLKNFSIDISNELPLFSWMVIGLGGVFFSRGDSTANVKESYENFIELNASLS